MIALKDCEYTAFISYAHADDVYWAGWVHHFCAELERSLRSSAVLRGTRLPGFHLSQENGPVAGGLSTELQERLAKSFAMIIVVHDNYAQSTWCLKELAYFKSLFGEQGLKDRLYILALSESAITAVAGGKEWQRLVADLELVWLPFFGDNDRVRPLDVYMAPGVVSTAFRVPFERLRNDFAAKLKEAVTADAQQSAGPGIAAVGKQPARLADAGSLAAESTAVVSTSADHAGFAPVPAPAPKVPTSLGPVLLAFVPKESEAALATARQQLGAAGVDLRPLTQDVVYGSFSEFDGAQHLVLPFDDSTPLMPIVGAGGHLQMLREAWIKKGHAEDTLHWLDLRSAPPLPAQWQGAAAYVASLGHSGLGVQALLQRWLPAGARPVEATAQAVRIYIESNRHERTLWEPLGEQIRLKWQDICAEMAPGRVPPLLLRARGLPVEEIDRFPNLDDADGVVLLWGRKTSEALVAQIDKVEGKLSTGTAVPPGIVAYLMPPQTSAEPMPAWGWNVLRFDAADEKNIDVVATERDELKAFLRKVFKRRQLRDGGGV